MEKIISSLVAQAPNLVAIIMVVALFLESIKKITKDFSNTIKDRDILFLDAMKAITNEIKEINESLITHSQETKAGINEMRRAVKKHTNKR